MRKNIKNKKVTQKEIQLCLEWLKGKASLRALRIALGIAPTNPNQAYVRITKALKAHYSRKNRL